MGKRLFCIGILSLLFLCQTLAADIPAPSKAFYVNDCAEVLNFDVKGEFVRILSELDQKGQAQIVAVTIPSLEREPIEEYAERMFDAYHIGGEWQKGALVLMIKDERQVYIKAGVGLADVLTPEICSSIVEEHAVKNLKKYRFMPAMHEMLFALRKTIDPTGTVAKPEKKFLEMVHPEAIFFLIVLAIVLIVSTFLFLRRKDKKNEEIPGVLNEIYYGDWRWRELSKLKGKNPKKRN